MITEDPIKAIEEMGGIMSANLSIEDPNNPASLPNIYKAPLGFILASIKKDQNKSFIDMFISTASEEALLIHGGEVGKPRNEASKANGYISLQGTVGVSIPQDTEFSANGNTYICMANTTIEAASMTITKATYDSFTGKATIEFATEHNLATGNKIDVAGFTSAGYNVVNVPVNVEDEFTLSYSTSGVTVTPAVGTGTMSHIAARIPIESLLTGSGQNLAAGTALTISTTIANVDSTGYVDYGAIGGGAETEEIETYRSRLLEYNASYPNTFNGDRIISHAKTITGVTDVKVFDATPNPGKVTIYFLRGKDVDPIPSASEIMRVRNKILEIKPAEIKESNVLVYAPIVEYIDTVISDLVPNTTAMQEAATVKIYSFINSLGIGQSFTIGSLTSAIFSTVDVYGNNIKSFTLVLPVADVIILDSEVAIPRNVQFV